MESSRIRSAMLFDFYGELLTEKQREYFDLHYNEDYSLTEIAEMSGISRQGVWDIIKRAEAALTEIEDKTRLIERFLERNGQIEELERELSKAGCLTDSVRDKLRRLKV
ncbi:MAG: YlxM family DNA-binding protein [Oscillospiraceae bacterium]|nr:YlxM family DNA-binding protein [Oscillospiraceae bacterium]